MKSQADFLDAVDHVVGEGIRRGALYQLAEDPVADGRTLTLDGRRVVQLGSCSYVGLELDERLKQGPSRRPSATARSSPRAAPMCGRASTASSSRSSTGSSACRP